LGKILRIEVGASGPYTIPASNPFIDTPDYRDEIWAEGVRNPWRFSFDPATGDLYIADVGQEGFEEVNYIPAANVEKGGMNFGWPVMEGGVCFPPSKTQDCDKSDFVNPVATYAHDSQFACTSITGGHVYRSSRPGQTPVYLYGDFCSGRVWGLQADGDSWATSLLDDFPFRITSFGQDEAGNVYVVDYDGVVYRIVDRMSFQFLPSLFKRE
jgi:glucose/arabinose dehydrogenase